MTYFNLRKQQPELDAEAEQEPVEEDLDEVEDESEDRAAPPAKQLPTSWPGAIWYGMSGPWRWLAAHLGNAGVNVAWVVHVGSLWAFFYYSGWVAATIAVGWLLAILLFIPEAYLDRLASGIERRDEGRSMPPARAEAPAEDAEPAAREAPVDPLPGILWDLIGEAPGVHLPSIVRHLHQTGLDRACDRAAVRAALGRRGIPIRPSVREADGRVNQGVHRDDLKGWEEALSQARAEAEPRARSYPATTALTSDVADPATAVATPSTPAA